MSDKYHAVPEVKENYKVAVDMSDKEGIDEVNTAQNFF